MSMDYGSATTGVGDFVRGDVLIEGKQHSRHWTQPVRRWRSRDRRAWQDRDAGLHRHPPPPGLDGDQKLHSRQHPDRRRHGHAKRATELFPNVLGGFQPPPFGFARHYRPQDVYISELFGGLSQLDNGVTTVHDISQIHHSPQHSDAAIQALVRYRAARCLRLLRECGRPAPRQSVPERCNSHQKSVVLIERPARAHAHGRRGLSRDATTQQSWDHRAPAWTCRLRRTFSRRSAYARSWTSLAERPAGNEPWQYRHRRTDNLFIHMTGHVGQGLEQGEGQVGAQVSIAFPIEMNMRHGIPPILKMQELGHRAVAQLGRRDQHDGLLLHPDALRHDHAAHGRERA